VHSRDNCVRLIEFESSQGPKIKKRFFGTVSKRLTVRSDVSPDGQYLVAGSEDGLPRVWDVGLEEARKVSDFECEIMDLVSDVAWNNRYNMFALCAFGQSFPVLIYVYERSLEELDRINISGGGISFDSPQADEYR